jgi:LPS sulfotransferase NodH
MKDRIIQAIKSAPWLNKNFGYLFELGTYLSYPFRQKVSPRRKFVIFGTGRSGSTLLVTLMNSNSQVFCDNEIYHRPVSNPWRYLRARTKLGGKEVYGFKCLTYHLGGPIGLAEEDQKEFLQQLHDEGYQILYLRRYNSLRQAISNIYARSRGQFHSNSVGAKKGPAPKVTVDLQELARWIDGVESQARREQGLLEGIPHLPISYEADLMDSADHPRLLARLSDYLEVDFEAPQTPLKKVTPKDFASFIENHEEMVAFLHEKGYAHYLAMAG